MSAEADVRVVAPRRPRDPTAAGGSVSTTREAGIIARHLAAAAALETRGEVALAAGARRVATVAALHLVATPVPSEADHAVVLDAARTVAAATPPEDRADVVGLLEAGAWAGAELRLAAGLRSWAAPPIGRFLEVSDPAGRGDGQDGDALDLDGTDLARYGAAREAADVDLALARSIEVLRNLVALPPGGEAAEAAWSRLSYTALGLCADPPRSSAERLDRRRALLRLWVTLRRRRPLVAAVLRRRLCLDRAAWPGPVG